MFSTDIRPTYACLFCRGHLGQNDLVEHCTAGRRLAFDSQKGRLWIVCPECGGWNLAPLDGRWEAIEECERLFSNTAVRVCTENVGLAVVYGSLDLIRIGQPFRQELAVWRYADELRCRRRRAILKVGAQAADQYGWMIGAGGLVGAGVALLVGAPAAIGFGMVAGAGTEELWREIGPERIEKLLGRIIAKVRVNTLDFSFVRTGHIPDVRLSEFDQDWRVELPHSVGWEGYTGEQAVHVMGLVLPVANGFGASQSQVVDAVKELEKVGDARAYFDKVAKRIRKSDLRKKGIGQYPMHVRLALEMAAHEETERQALQGRLKWLERRWRQAEEIAEIADNLFTMPAIETRITHHKHTG
jgi:hypothetical protein